MTRIPNILRALLPAGLLSLTGCVVLAILFGLTFADVLLQVGCEQCFGESPGILIAANGVEGREIRESESPGLPPTEVIDQEPEDPSFLAGINETCDALFALFDLLGAPPGPAQSVGQIRSGGFAFDAPPAAAARYRGEGANPGAPALVYLTNSVNDTVLAIDLESRSLVGSAGVGERPRGIAVTPDGARLFVANEDSGSVSVVQTDGLAETTRIGLPGAAEPYHVAITPDGAEAWVASHEPSGFVHVIDTASLTVVESLRVGRRPVQVALSPDGTLAYVTNEDDNRLSVVDVWTRRVQRSLTVPSPYAVAFDPTGARVYVSSHSSPGTVRMIDVATDAVLATWEVGMKPEAVALDAFATRLYVSNRLSDYLSVINLLTGEVEREIAVPRGLGPVAFAPY